MPEIVVASACCCGITCRWHGRPTRKSKAIRELEKSGVQVWPVCPEMLGGLPCPRPPVKSKGGRIFETDPETRTEIGREITHIFTAGAILAKQVAVQVGAERAFMMKMSPSCAPNGIAGRIFREAGIEVVPIW